MRTWTVFRFMGGRLREKEGVGIFEGWLVPQCTLWFSLTDFEFEMKMSKYVILKIAYVFDML